MLRHNRRMRASDRPGAGSFDGDRGDLAGRLARLPDAHPSSPRDPAGEPGPDDVAAEDAGPDELGPEADLEEPGPDGEEESGEPGTEVPGPSVSRPGLRAAGGAGPRDPYRPWFADGGPGQPWFAADPGRDG
jgi:hypothetical protein